MDNLPAQPGNQQIVIENVTADNMLVNVNGELKNIRNGLDELKSLLQGIQAESFKSGDKIYNIGSITNATFSAEIGKKSFNLFLYRKLTEAIQEYSPDAKSFLDKLKEADKASWETQSRYTDKVKVYIVSSFVGVLGILLRKLFASGKDALATGNYKDYHEVCIATATRTLQLLCYAFISSFWDYSKNTKYPLTSDQHATLDNFFTTDVEPNIVEYANLLKTLVAVFREQQLDYPFIELKSMDADLANGSGFLTACKNLQEISNTLDKGQFTLSTAFTAEAELTTFLVTLKFLASYKMASVKDILYEEVRNSAAQYLHAYNLLGGDYESKSIQKFKYDKNPISTDAILLYKNRYLEGLNLFPFIIDINALTDEKEVKICFYSYYEENQGKNTKNLTYTHIDEIASANGDNDLQNAAVITISYNDEIEKNITSSIDMDITWLKADSKKFYEMKLNEVYKTFQQAKASILE